MECNKVVLFHELPSTHWALKILDEKTGDQYTFTCALTRRPISERAETFTLAATVLCKGHFGADMNKRTGIGRKNETYQ